MLAAQRQSTILDTLRVKGAVSVASLTADLGVSEMTVRRDLQKMEARGALVRVYGGAVLVDGAPRPASGVDEPTFTEKSLLERDAKLAIASRAAEMVRPGTSIGVSAGTTTWGLSPYLAEISQLTVVTNSIAISERIARLGQPAEQTVILTGGVRTPSAGLVGLMADLTLRAVNIDQLFIGCFGMDPLAGLTSPSFAEAETNRTFVGQARRVVVLADATKWQTLGLASWASLDQVDVVVTDDRLPDSARKQIADAVRELVVVHPHS